MGPQHYTPDEWAIIQANAMQLAGGPMTADAIIQILKSNNPKK